MSTVRRIVDDALNVLGEVQGAGVSTYSDDRMMHDAIRSFNLLFKKYYWPHMLEWFRVQLDGTIGTVPVDTFAYVRDIEDFYAVYRDGETNPLPAISKNINPYSLRGDKLIGWSLMPITSPNYENRYLQFYPKTSTEYVNVCARVYPRANGVPWDWNDEMPLDHDMIVCGTAFMTLMSDNINPDAQDGQRNMMEIRYRDIIAGLSNQPLPLRGNNVIPTQWFPKP
jgi:hypothetical protein